MSKLLTGRLQNVDDQWIILYNALQGEGYKLEEIQLAIIENNIAKVGLLLAETNIMLKESLRDK